MLTTFLLVVLLATAVRLPASVCPVASAPIGKGCQMGCCASKCCCVQLQKQQNLPSTPLAKDGAADVQPLVAVAATVIPFVTPPQPFHISPNTSAFLVADQAPRP